MFESDWILKLSKMLTAIRSAREAELRRLNDIVNVDPELLAERYVETHCSQANPADFNEEEGDVPVTTPWPQAFKKFLSSRFTEKDGRHVAVVLADAGMGKTWLLAILRLTHLLRFWPAGVDFALFKLGPTTLDEVAKIKDKRSTVLLLDSLDEDPEAWEGAKERLSNILRMTKAFSHVIISCRTQFFPLDEPVEKMGKISVAGYTCNVLYIVPFTAEQVDEYLRKTFRPKGIVAFIRERLTHEHRAKFERAAGLVSGPMGTLGMRPMLLAQIEPLIDEDLKVASSYELYRIMVDKWLAREVRKAKKSDVGIDTLWEFFEQLACNLHASGKRETSIVGLLEVEGKMRGEDIASSLVLSEPETDSVLKLLREKLDFFLKEQVLAVDPSMKFDLMKNIEGLGEEISELEKRKEAGASAGSLATVAALVNKFDFGGKSLLNRNSSGNFRFAHYSIQEFLVAHAIVKGRLQGAQRYTDQLFRFLQGMSRNVQQGWTKAPLIDARVLEEVDRLVDVLRRNTEFGLRLVGVNLAGANLSGADLSGADLSSANLSSADLSEADLSEADLAGTLLSDTNLNDAIVSQEQINFAIGNIGTTLPEDLSHPDHWPPELLKSEVRS